MNPDILDLAMVYHLFGSKANMNQTNIGISIDDVLHHMSVSILTFVL